MLPEKVQPEEPTIKFLFDEGHYKEHETDPSFDVVRQAAFKPAKKTKNISVYRTQGISDEDAFEIGREFVTELRADKKPILAGARLRASVYFDNSLVIDPDGKPHPRHANVFGWPWDKDVQRELRIELARKAELVRYPRAQGRANP